MQPLDLTLLRSFVALIDCGSIQLAAARVGRSQSAVSMQIKRLEEAGDAMVETTTTPAAEAWNKAKEAKL